VPPACVLVNRIGEEEAMSTARVLVVEDDPIVLMSLVEFLKSDGHTVYKAPTVPDAVRIVDAHPLDIIFSDVYVGEGNAFSLLEHVTETKPGLEMVLMTGYGTVDDAVKAIRMGAANYVTKPLVDNEIRLVIEQTLKRHDLKEENETLHTAAREEFDVGNIVCSDPEMVKVVRMIKAVANTKTTMLITGESGTGKTMLARAIHFNSGRASGPFVEVSCGALTESLLESELFGHEAGAFTGATHRKTGKFEAAQGGTIFLDEIATASPGLQVKLLRVIQDGLFERVGGTEMLHVNARIVLATNCDLAHEVAEGRFREDLYYRIHVVPIHVPPLRDRRSDIPKLAAYFIEKHATEAEKRVTGLTEEAAEALLRCDWPGNVRQLENVIERAVLLTQEEQIGLADLPTEIAEGEKLTRLSLYRPNGKIVPLKEALEGPEREIILRALEHADWNRDEAARLLGINRSTLFNKLKRLHLNEMIAGH
jgi:DNA-binding NtrC family response regulator